MVCNSLLMHTYSENKRNMELFDNLIDSQRNLLPKDGTANYYGSIIAPSKADELFQQLQQTIAWKNDEAIVFGKKIATKRKVAWHGDKPFSYTYSKVTKLALPWTPLLLSLKELVEGQSGETFNACLLNLYHSGEEGMAWHSDGERNLKKNGAIGSLSFGAERKFAFKHKTSKEKVELILAHGSLLVMKGETQTHWLHRLPPKKHLNQPRVNLTFRTIIG